MQVPYPPREPPVFGKRETIFERIEDVKAASDRVTKARQSIKDHPRDHSLQVELQVASRELDAALKGTRGQLRLINSNPEPNL